VLWREGARRASSEPPKDSERDSQAKPTERASPGLAALFETLREGGNHSVLDLGPARGQHLHVLAPFGPQVRFAGLVPRSLLGEEWASALTALPPNDASPYDVVLGWDLLTWLDPAERAAATERLAQITAPHARIHLIVDGTGAATAQALEYTLVGPGRLTEQALGPPRPVSHPLLPAQLERALSPLEVKRAFVLRSGGREFIAKKRR
jgi:hypothetical protein